MKIIFRLPLQITLIVLGLLFFGSLAIADTSDRVIYYLEEMWQISGFDDDLIIGFINDAAIDENGRFYLLDTQLSQICVVDTTGELVGLLGREGEAPGEFRNPSSIAWWGDGMLAVAQAIPGRLELISTDGNPGGSIHYLRAGETQVTGISRFEPYSDGFVIQTSVGTGTGSSVVSKNKLVRCDRDGHEIDALKEHELTQNVDNFIMDEKQMLPPWLEWVCTNNGELIWINDRDQYSLSISRTSGAEEIFADREYQSLARPSEDVASMKEAWEADVRDYFPNPKAVIEKNHAAIIRLLLGPSEQVWVVTSRNDQGKEEGSLIEGEVHGLDGAWLGKAEMILPEGMVGGRLLVLDWPFVLAGFSIDEDGVYSTDPRGCEDCVPVYAAFRVRGPEPPRVLR